MIKVGLHVKPLQPMRDPRRIVIDALACVKGGIELQGGHIYALTDFRHPNGQDRICEAAAILAHLCADRNPNVLKEVFAAKRRDDLKSAKQKRPVGLIADDIMDAINDERDRVRQAGGVFTVADIRPIIEKALS